MSTEPERPIEKLLRDYAKKRREQAGAPLELHPVNRRLLQAEVAARNRKAAPESGRVFSVLGKLLWGGAAVAVMAIIVALFVPSLRSPHEEMAKNELTLVTNSIEESTPIAAEPNTTSSAETATSLAMLDSKVASKALKEEAKSTSLSGVPATTSVSVDSLAGQGIATAQNAPAMPAPVAAPAAAPPGLGAGQEKEGVAAQGFNRLRFGAVNSNSGALAAADKLADIPSESAGTSSVMTFAAAPASLAQNSDGARRALLSFDTAKKEKDLAASQYSARLGALAQGAAAGVSVMDNFSLERSGAAVRIVDGDGSVYSGFVQADEMKLPAGAVSNIEPRPTAGATRVPQARVEADTSVSANLTNAVSYSFFVSGTNQTLKELVSFSGTFQPSTNTVAMKAFGGGVAGTGGAFSVQQAPPQQTTALVQGKLRIGGSTEKAFQAVARP